MMKIWGRADGSNVIKVMWCIGELGIPCERIDWGGRFGGNDDPDYRRKNPNGRLPTLEEDDGFTLWESNAIVRYLCAKHDLGGMCPGDLRERASADKWMDWASINLRAFNLVFLAEFIRSAREERNGEKIAKVIDETLPFFNILDQALSDRAYLCGEKLTMADIPAGSLAHRWLNWPEQRPQHPNIEAWYQRLCERPAFVEHVLKPNPVPR